MKNMFQVAIHYGKSYGRIEYDPVQKKANVILGNEVKKKQVEEYLATTRDMLHARNSLRDFEQVQVRPLDNLEALKLALTKLWETTEVYVDWSRPADDTYRV